MSISELSLGSSEWWIGADIGGTFTDVILLGPNSALIAVKVLSTPPDFGTGVLDACLAALQEANIVPGKVDKVLHGTTVATNAILEMDGAKTALVTTRGFRDVLEIGRLRRPRPYDLNWEKPAPLAKRRYRYELNQRITAAGELQPPFDPMEVAALAEDIERNQITAIAVCLINSYLRPDEERRVAAELQGQLPDVYITASIDISPELREFERTSTAVVNSYVGPIVRSYISELSAGLRSNGIEAPFLIMQSGGGLLDAESVIERPVQIIESGPAAGVTAVQKLAKAMGLAKVVAFDMGGTTAKASLIEDGEPFVTTDYEVGGGMNVSRGLSKGAGYAVRVPSIDIAEVGAGGGSIISVDLAGALHVGPESAGARPGPACYGLGGKKPTLTDANVALGYLSPSSLAGGRVPISKEMAEEVIKDISAKLDMQVEWAAKGAYDVAVSNMTKAVRAVTSERGRDPRESVLVAFGGAGPLYGAYLAKELGIQTIIVPLHPGLFSSLGLLVADVQTERVTPFTQDLANAKSLTIAFEELESLVAKQISKSGGDSQSVRLERLFDMRYRGQRFEMRVAVDGGTLDDDSLQEIRNRFHAVHFKTYGRAGTDELIEVVNLRVRGSVANPIELGRVLGGELNPLRKKTYRVCQFDDAIDTPVISRGDLGIESVPGPIIIEDMDSTTLVPPGATCRRDPLNNIVITWDDQIKVKR